MRGQVPRIPGSACAQIGDAGAVAGGIRPEAVNSRRMHVAVELQGGHTRGRTVVDAREFVMPPDRPQCPPNVDVVVSVDADALKQVFAEAVFG